MAEFGRQVNSPWLCSELQSEVRQLLIADAVIFVMLIAAVFLLLVGLVCRVFWKATVTVRDPSFRVTPQDPWQVFESIIDKNLWKPEAMGWLLMVLGLLVLGLSFLRAQWFMVFTVPLLLAPFIPTLALAPCLVASRRAASLTRLMAVTIVLMILEILILVAMLMVGAWLVRDSLSFLWVLVALLMAVPFMLSAAHAWARRKGAEWFPIEGNTAE